MVKKFENNATIFYYSGTGNSLYTAKRIQENFKDAVLVSIPMLSDSIIECNSDIVGFVFPVHGWFLPPVVFDFIQKLNLIKPSYIFAIATYGLISGKAMSALNAMISNKGHKLHYGKKIKMPANSVVSYQVGRNAASISLKAEKKILKISEDLRQKKESVIGKNISLNKKHYSLALEKRKKYLQRGKLFYATNSCVKCGKCVEICPVSNINMDVTGIHFSEKCIQCMACINWCPQRAINLGGKTEKRNRYTNPNISYRELVERNQSLI